MSMKRNTARRVIGTAMLAVGVLLFTSCPREVGLGSAVDTAKPVVTISTPEADSVIKGNITLSGTVTDDRGVKSVTVTFASTSQPGLAAKTYPATVDTKTNTWSLVVNSTDKDTGLTDSAYEIAVTASDTTNKTSTATRSIQLDNTAPTVLITSPSLYGSVENRTKFCSQLEIKGEAYDATKIQSVQVTLCDANGTTVAGPLTADGTNTWSAMFGASDLTRLQDNVVYYFYATATDASGNINSTFYHKADIYGKLPQNSMFPSVNDIGHLDQRTAASANCQLKEADLLSVRIGTGAAGISARLAAGAGYPDFTYQATADAAILWTNLGDTVATSAIGVNTAIFATIQPPTDNSAILLDSIEIKVRSTNGEWENQTSLTKQKVGESVNISVSPKKNGQPCTEGSYEISLKCKTNSNAEISSNKEFQIQSDAPIIEESSVGSGSAAFAQGIMSETSSISGLSGKFLRSTGEPIPLSNLSQGSFIITCKDSSGSTVSPADGWYITSNGSSNNGAVIYNEATGIWSLSVPVTGTNAFANDTYTFSISGTLGEAVTMITRVVVVDTENPVVSLGSPAAGSCITISDSGAGLTLQGSASDTGSGIQATYWCIDEATASYTPQTADVALAAALGDNAVPDEGTWYKFSTPTVFNMSPNMDRSRYAEKNYRFFIFTKDQAGHVSDVTGVPFFIDNAKPEISVSWPQDLIRQNASGMTISGKAWDTSGNLEKVWVSFDGTDSVMVEDLTTGTSYTSEASAADWTFPGSAVIPDDSWTEGTHTLAFSVKDKAGRISDVATKTFTIDRTDPEVTVANLTDNAVLADMTPISGTAIDTLSGLKENGVTYSLDFGQTWMNATNQSGAWSITLPANSGEGSQQINIKAEDKAGNTCETGDIHFTIDKDDPRASICVNQEESQTADTFLTKEGFTLSGTADDAAQTTGRQADKVKLTYSRDGGSAVTVFDTDAGINAGCWNQIAGTWSWNTESVTDFSEGFYTFTLTVTDKADKKATATKSIRYDHTAPSLTVTTPAENEPFDSQTITMTGTVSDSGIGVDKIYYTLDGVDPTTSSDSITPVGYSWSKEVSFADEGVHTLRIMASDVLGNLTTVQTIRFSRDDAKPSLDELSVTANGKTTNAGFSLAGVAWDTNGLDYVTITDGTTTWSSNVSKVANSKGGISLTPATSEPASNNWNIDFVVGSDNASNEKYVSDGTKTFTITVTDVAGKTASVSRSVKIDTTKPSIEAPVLQNTLVKLDESAYNKLTVTASDSGTGLAGIWYQVTGSGDNAPSFDNETGWTALALSSSTSSDSTWTGNIDFTGKAEGEHKIYVAAKDTADNRVRYGETATTGPAATTVKVDEKKPVITVTGLTEAAKADVELTIVIDDTNPDAAKLTAEVKTPAGLSIGYLTPVAAGANTWKVTVPFSASAASTDPYHEDGLYKIVVNETDTRGRNAETVTHTIRKDTTAPEINTIDTPDSDKTGADALYGTSFVFRGTAKDKSDTSACAGVSKILYAFTQSSTAPSDMNAYTPLSVSDGTPWNITMDLAEGHTAQAGTLSEGKWYLYVLAEDKSGNRTVTPAKREFDVDMKDPVLSITAPADSTQTSYTENASFIFGGTATDTNGIAKNASGKKYVTVKVGTADAVEVEVAENGTWTYSYTRTTENKDRLLTATITATDMAGKFVIKSVPFYFDTLAPEITINKPAEGEAIVVDSSNKYTISGMATDLGKGVDPDQATFIITDAASQTIASGDLAVSGASWSASVDFTDKAEGTLTLKVTVADKLGQSASLSKSFFYDKADPELRVATVSTTGLTTNADFQLAGTAWDTNGLDCITVSDGTNTWTSAGVSPTISLTKKTSDPGTAVADRNWHIDFGVGSSTSGIHVADGMTTFTITVRDVAGKSSTVTRTVTVDTTAPSVSSVALEGSAAIPSGKVYLDESKFKKITVTAADPDSAANISGTGLAGVYYQIVTTASSAPSFTTDTGWTSLALGSDGWTGNIDFSGKSEGSYKIYAAAKDNAGNRAVFGTATPVTVDAKKPVTTISGASDAKNENVTLTITVEDTNPGTPVITVLKPKDDGTAGGVALSDARLTVSDPASVAGGKKWTVTVPFSNAVYNTDGVYTVVVNETDANGRVADEKTHTIRRDVTAPTAVISTPVAGRTGANALFGDSYRFTGTAADNAGGSGIAKILYAFTSSADEPAAALWTELTVTDESWTISRELVSGTATPPAGSLSEGTWYLHVLAEDKAGNRTAAADRAVRTFDIDLNNPELAITKAAGKPLTDLTKTNYTKNNTIKLEGTASDTNGVASVSVKIGDAAAENATYNQAAGKWEYTCSRSEANKDQLLTATVTVTDAAGKTAVKTVPFYFDTQAPTVSITQPAPDEKTSTNTYTISGTVADVGAGVAVNTAADIAEYAAAGTSATRKAELYSNAKAKYEIKNGTETVAKGLLPVTGANWSAAVDLDDNSLTKKEGELTLTVYLEDTLGNKASSPITRTFYYDKTPPAITENGVGSSLTTKDAFTFSGSATDTNALAGDGIGAIQVTVVKGSETVATDTIDVDGSGAWSKTFTPGSSISSSTLTDGTFNFTFTVTDVAGRTAMTTSKVVIDRSAPVINKADGQSSFLTDTPTADGSWFKKEYLALKAKVTDNAAGSVVSSGVSMVEYAVISNPASIPDAATWNDNSIVWNTMTMGASSVCTANAQVAGGTNYLCIRATDAAGNITYSTQEIVKVDLRAPAILGVYTDADCTASLVNSTYLTSQKDIALYLKTSESANNGTPSRAGSGIKELKVTLNGNTVNATAVNGKADTFILSVNATDLNTYLATEGTHIISAEISDIAGNSTSVSQLFTIQYDKVPPAVVIKTPAAGSTVNKTISVTGTASDSQSLESVMLYKGDFTGAIAPAETDKLAAFTGNDRYNWTYTLNTYDSTNSPKTYVATTSSMTLTVIAKDTAGNVTKEKVAFSVDQSADIPVISFNNIAMNGMTSSAPVRLTSGKTIYGSVTDDDGSVKKLEISTDGKDSSAADKVWQELTVNNGSFTTVVNSTEYLADGSYIIQFRVTDKEDTVFTTPVLKGSDDARSVDGNLYLIVDTTNPVAPTPKFSLTGTDSSWSSDLLMTKTFSKSLPAVTTAAQANALAADVGADSFWIQQAAYDANGIEKVEVAIGSDANYSAATPVLNGDGTRKTDEDGYDIFKYQVTHDQIAAVSSGTQTIYIKVTDNVGKEQTVNANFSVDNDAPAVEVSSHTQNEHVKGDFYVGGTSNDAPKNKGAKSLVYKVTASATRPADDAWTVAPVSDLTYAAHEISSDNLASWRIYFDNDFANDGYAHDRPFKYVLVSIPEYADYLMVTSEQKVVYSRDYNGHHANDAFVGPNNGYVQLYIHFKATDAFGNTSYTSIPLMFDPQGDIPSVAISYPGATAYGWQHTTVSGQTRTATVVYTAKQTNLKAGDSVYKTLDAVIKNTPDGQITAVDTANSKITAVIAGVTTEYTLFGGACIQGGVIRVQGTALAEGTNKISGVYLQIDPTYDPAYGFQWTNDGTAGSELMPYGGVAAAQRPANKSLSAKYTPVAITDSLKGISVGSTGAWSISLNGSGEFDSTDSDTSNMIAVRAVVKDDKNNVSPITDAIIITVDSDTPRIGASEPLVLRQYSDNANGTGTVTAEQEYTDDMWLKGEWWLEGSVEDSKGISKLEVAGNNVIDANLAETWNAGLTSESEGYRLHYQIGNTTNGEFGKLTYKISAEDNDDPHKTVEKTISVRYDNKAPVLEGTNDQDYNIKKEVVQKNGFYTLGSGVVEAGEAGNVQSGFERLALYFVRRGTGSGASATVDRLFDTYFVKSSVDGNTNNELALTGLRYDTTDNLYYLQNKTVGHSGNSDKITLTAADANIHKGGMVKIRGAYYIIKDMSADGKTITLDRALADLGATETAQFALAMIVDNTQTEKAGTLDTNGYYKPSNSDDGDCMLESVNTSNGTTVWEANINSRNIPDGAIEIHYVAFDKAGNSAHGVVNGTVANNAPRLAGVRYGVDNNGDGDVSGSELKDKLFAMDNGKYIDSDLKTSYILKKSGGEEIQDNDAIVKIKGAVKVIPEIVGGNGDLYYGWSVTENGETSPYYTWSVTESGLAKTVTPLKNGDTQISGSDYTGKGLAEEIKEAGILLTMKDLLKGNIKDGNAGKNQLFTFTIWDSTEGMTPGSLVEGEGSQRAVIKMVADVKLKDDAKPSAVITPFYWQNKNSNSVYRTTDENENTIMQGHIDLSADLPAANFPTSTTSGALDRDDKASGAIVIEGTATDDTLLSGLYMKIYSGTGTNQFAFTGVNAITASDAIAVNTMPTGGTSPLVGYYKVASYNGSWTGSDFYAANGWKFEAGNDEFDENGHTTHWKLTLNTEMLSSTVIADLKVSVLATDMGAPTLSGENITYKENVNTAAAVKSTTASPSGMYQFDVVPYIRSMKTSISESAGAEFARSATGRYSVRNGEEVKVYGWNLDTSSATSTSVKLGNTALTTAQGGTDEDGTYVKAKIGSTSGNIKVTVADIDSLNNLNSNDAAGTHTDSQGNTVNVTDANYATYAYNRVPNGVTNNRLSDDVSIWVWDFGAFVDGTNITSPMMKMGPDSKWYMSYGNGIQEMMVNLNGTTRRVDYSYNKFHNTNVAFDASGRIWAVAMNTDRIRDDSSRYVLYVPLNGTMPTTSENDSTEYRASSDTKRHLELAYNGETFQYNINRTKNAKLITETVNGNTVIATSYYDANNTINPVKVRFGTMGKTVVKEGVTFTYNSNITVWTKSGTFSTSWKSSTEKGWQITGNDNYDGKVITIDGTDYSLTRTAYYDKKNDNSQDTYYYTINGYSGTQTLSNVTVYNPMSLSGGITGQIGDGVTSSGSTPKITMTQSNDPTGTDSSAKGYHIVASEDTTIKGGAYTAVGIVPSNKGTNGYVGVIAWYDAQAKKLAFSYNTDPDTAYVASNSDNQWMKHAFYVDSSAYTGWYVDMIVDDDGGIHLAYYDSGKGDLKYAYLSSFEDTTADVVTVDSYLSVGTDITINIREENGRQVPYIYYYNASATQTTNSVRVAWQENATLGAGAVSDKFTGNWEVMTIPTAGVPVDATVCGGVPTSGTYANKVVLGYMTDTRYERAVLQK